ncbi:hypothetical protein OOU_Y34scaffold00871g8 [Pyricularia oryzae Y34]|uniref:HNH nuclease domain-containing protein n=2 Tax=Pyricularia oryzae TaxID=318829 RepID=A0AA97NPB7_PYRO3|nr:hypothetical protein OOU_Y34scaffold00871g8 [Pyricularia oryzae Y34]
MSTPFLRQPLSAPESLANQNGGRYNVIRIRHPAYPASAPDLLQLSATDGDNWNGLDLDVARAACSVVTTVSWDEGIFAVQSDASSGSLSAVERPADGILRGSVYFWCRRLSDQGIDPVAASVEQYPVYASFQHWRFPHSNLPEPWRHVTLPAHEPLNAIYVQNPMSHLPIDDESNLILLRRDLQFLFDRNRYVFVPKRPSLPSTSQSSSPAIAIAIHILQPQRSVQLVSTYHNRLTQQPLCGLSREMLFSRFAWALFHEELMTFFSGDGKVVVRTWDKAASCVKEDTCSANTVARIAQIFEPVGTRSRSASPRKRALLSQDRDLCDQPNFGWDDKGSDDEENDSGDEEEDMERRGRGRRRSWSPTAKLNGVPSLAGSFVSVASVASHGTAPEESAQNAFVLKGRKRSCEEDIGNGQKSAKQIRTRH